MDIIQLIPLIYDKFIIFILVFTRISTMLFTFNLFRRDLITTRIVLSLSAIISGYVLLQQQNIQITYDYFSLQMLMLILFQTFIGFISALILNVIFEIFVAVGQILSTQVGLSTASLIDLRFGYITSLTHFYMMSTTILFLMLNGHLFAIKSIFDSFDALPIIKMFDPNSLIMDILNYASIIFSGAVMLSISMMLILLLTNLSIAVMSKFAPQFNLFSIGINMQLIVGLVCIYLTFNLYIHASTARITDCITFFQQAMLKLKNYG